MEGFKAGLSWFWAEPVAVLGGRRKQSVVRIHLILGGLPEELWKRIEQFVPIGGGTWTFTSSKRLYRSVNLVIVLKSNCTKLVSARRQFNNLAEQCLDDGGLDDD